MGKLYFRVLHASLSLSSVQMICFNFYIDKQSVEDILREIVTTSKVALTNIYYYYYYHHTVSSAGGAAGPLPRGVPHPRPLHSHRAGLGHRHPRLPQPQQGEGGRPSLRILCPNFYWVLPFHIPFECIVAGPGEYLVYLPCDQSCNSGRVKRLNPGSRTSPLRRSQHK